MLSGDDFWIDGQDRKQYNWGGAKTTGKVRKIGRYQRGNQNL